MPVPVRLLVARLFSGVQAAEWTVRLRAGSMATRTRGGAVRPVAGGHTAAGGRRRLASLGRMGRTLLVDGGGGSGDGKKVDVGVGGDVVVSNTLMSLPPKWSGRLWKGAGQARGGSCLWMG